MQSGLVDLIGMGSAFSTIAEPEFQELDAEDVAGAEALGEIARGVPLRRSRHPEIELAEKVGCRILGTQQLSLCVRMPPAFDIPKGDRRRLVRS